MDCGFVIIQTIIINYIEWDPNRKATPDSVDFSLLTSWFFMYGVGSQGRILIEKMLTFILKRSNVMIYGICICTYMQTFWYNVESQLLRRVTLGNSSCPKEVQSFILKFFLRSAIHIIWNHYKIILLQWGLMLNIRISEEKSKTF